MTDAGQGRAQQHQSQGSLAAKEPGISQPPPGSPRPGLPRSWTLVAHPQAALVGLRSGDDAGGP